MACTLFSAYHNATMRWLTLKKKKSLVTPISDDAKWSLTSVRNLNLLLTLENYSVHYIGSRRPSFLQTEHFIMTSPLSDAGGSFTPPFMMSWTSSNTSLFRNILFVNWAYVMGWVMVHAWWKIRGCKCRTAGYMHVVLHYVHSLQIIQTRREQSCFSALQQLQK